jgi:hypothetical protein
VQHLPEKAKLAAKQGRKTADLKLDSRVAQPSNPVFLLGKAAFKDKRTSRRLDYEKSMAHLLCILIGFRSSSQRLCHKHFGGTG